MTFPASINGRFSVDWAQRVQAAKNFIQEEIYLQKSRVLLWSVSVFGMGIAVYFSLKFEPEWWVVLLFLAVSVLVTGIGFFFRRRYTFGKILLVLGGAAFLFCGGFAGIKIRSDIVHTEMLQAPHGPVKVLGKIDGIELEEKGTRIVLKNLQVEDLPAQDTPRKIRLVVKKESNFNIGDTVEVLAKLNPVAPPVAPGAFDFQRYMYFKSIGAVGFALQAPVVVEHAQGRHFFKFVQLAIATRLEKVMEYPASSFSNILLTGQRGTLKEEDTQAMRDAGLAHLLAISGMNIGMVAGILFFLCRFGMALFPGFALYHPIKKYAAVFAFIGIFFYTALVGDSVPTQRALLMTSVVLLAILVDRQAISMRIVALAAFVLLIMAPESLVNISFQMSFAAVVGLISFYESMREKWGDFFADAGILRRVGLYILGIVATTLISEFAVAPFSIFHFQNFAVYSVLANLLALPALAFLVMPALVVGLFLMPVGLDFIPFWIAAKGIEFILWAAHFTAGLEGAVFHFPAFDSAGLIWLVVGGMFLLFGVRYVRLVCLPCLVMGILFAVQTRQPDIYVSTKGELFAIQDRQGNLTFSSRRKDKYSAENWMRMNGQEGQKPTFWPKEGAFQEADLHCDPAGCRAMREGIKISFVYLPSALAEECGWADILISAIPVDKGSCKAVLEIDRFDVAKKGAHSITLNNTAQKFLVRNVEDTRGYRIWHAAKSSI